MMMAQNHFACVLYVVVAVSEILSPSLVTHCSKAKGVLDAEGGEGDRLIPSINFPRPCFLPDHQTLQLVPVVLFQEYLPHHGEYECIVYRLGQLTLHAH
jgi:hypothetical protein